MCIRDRDLRQVVKAFVDMAKAINSIVGAVLDLADAWRRATEQAKNYNSRFSFPGAPASPSSRDKSGPNVPADRQPSAVPITVNFNAPIDSVSAGREVARVLSDYHRASGIR
jgi:hypothetical protein